MVKVVFLFHCTEQSLYCFLGIVTEQQWSGQNAVHLVKLPPQSNLGGGFFLLLRFVILRDLANSLAAK